MTRIVALLEAKGLVRLEPHPDDRRQKVVSQTEQAEAMLEESRRKRNAWLAALAEGLDEDEWAKLRAAAPSWRSSHTCRPRAEEATHFEYGTRSRLRTRPQTRYLHPSGRGTFSSLRIRNYRLFFTGAIVSNTGTWMARITQDWLVLSLTGSAAAVGVTTALQFLPMLLFGLYGGVVADRYPKRQLLLVSQAALGLCGVALAVLTLSGHVQVWHVYLIAFLLGMVTVVDNPARQSFVSEMVGPEQLRNAVSLNSANFQSARLVGPAVAGVLIAGVGSGWAFLLNGLSFVAPVVSLLLMRTGELHKVERVPRGKGSSGRGCGTWPGGPIWCGPSCWWGSSGRSGSTSRSGSPLLPTGSSTWGPVRTGSSTR